MDTVAPRALWIAGSLCVILTLALVVWAFMYKKNLTDSELRGSYKAVASLQAEANVLNEFHLRNEIPKNFVLSETEHILESLKNEQENITNLLQSK
jgi:hypothetical protein